MVGYLSYIPEAALSEMLLKKVREKAAHCTEEEWKYYVFHALPEVEDWLRSQKLLHLASWDITKTGALKGLERFRKEQEEALLLLIADEKMSPLHYLKPEIMPGALLLKPVSQADAEKTVGAFVDAFLQKFYSDAPGMLFCAETREGRIQIPYAQILYFEAREKKVFVRTGKEEYGFYSSLNLLQKELPEYFVQCHRSFLVNMRHVQKMDKANGQLLTEQFVPVPYSRSYRRRVEAYWNER